ncbi:SDR family oxidoreductase [Tsukamurella sp. NPDC003166]|uniref:SDR family oxidoreductase n=1 Tax=Tsukamurella sp. NPDC003166 TaxID=3154444 RepID=UPI0033AB477D
MSNQKIVLTLGANGRIARHVVSALADSDGVHQRLFVRNAAKLTDVPANAEVVVGDATDEASLRAAVRGADVVYANLTGDDIDVQGERVVAALQAEGVRRLIFVASLGIYDEVPGAFGEWNRAIIGEPLKPFRRAADAIEASGLDYTILRPGWLDDEAAISYEVTEKGEAFRGTVVSRPSVAALITAIINDPALHSKGNIGVDRPGTDGPKPYFM